MFLLVFKSFLPLSNPSNLSCWIITSLKETHYAWLISASSTLPLHLVNDKTGVQQSSWSTYHSRKGKWQKERMTLK